MRIASLCGLQIVVAVCCRATTIITALGRREYFLDLLPAAVAAGRLHTRVTIIAVCHLKAGLAQVQIPRLS